MGPARTVSMADSTAAIASAALCNQMQDHFRFLELRVRKLFQFGGQGLFCRPDVDQTLLQRSAPKLFLAPA